MKEFALKVTVVFAIVLAAVVLWQLRDIVGLVLVSLAITAAMRAPIAHLIGRGWRKSLAIVLVYVVGLGVIVGLFFLLGYPLTGEFTQLSNSIMIAYTRLQSGSRFFGGLEAFLAEHLPTVDQVADFLTGDQMSAVGQAVFDITQNISTVVGQFLLAMVLSIYWSADQVRFERFWLSLLPAQQRTPAREVWRAMETQVGAYIRSEVVQGVMASILLAPGFWLLGVPYPVIWAVLISLGWFVPLVGGLIFLIPLWLLTWAGEGALLASAAVLYTVGVLTLMEFVVERRFYSHTRYNNVLVIVVMLMLVSEYGIVGLLVAPLLAIAIEVLLAKLVERNAKAPVTPLVDLITYQEVSLLQARLQEIRPQLPAVETPSALRLANIAERLEGLLKEAESL